MWLLSCAVWVWAVGVSELNDVWSRRVYPYNDDGLPAPGDGPSVVWLSHHGDAHTAPIITDCEQCGRNVAAELRRLGVGSGGE